MRPSSMRPSSISALHSKEAKCFKLFIAPSNLFLFFHWAEIYICIQSVFNTYLLYSHTDFGFSQQFCCKFCTSVQFLIYCHYFTVQLFVICVNILIVLSDSSPVFSCLGRRKRILSDSTCRFFSARSVADVWVALPLAGKAAGTQWEGMADDSTGRRNEFIHTRLVPRG